MVGLTLFVVMVSFRYRLYCVAVITIVLFGAVPETVYEQEPVPYGMVPEVESAVLLRTIISTVSPHRLASMRTSALCASERIRFPAKAPERLAPRAMETVRLAITRTI